MTLGKLIKYLEDLDNNTRFVMGWELGKSCLYKKRYGNIAFSPKIFGLKENILYEAKSVLGKTYESYNGGQYTVDENAICFLAQQYLDGLLITEQLLESLRID